MYKADFAPSHASGLLGEHASPAVIREHDQRQDPPRSTLHCPAGARRPMGVPGLVRGGPHACLDLAFRLAHDLDPSFNLIWRARVFLPSREPSSPRARLRRQRVPTPAGVHGSTRWKGDESRARDQKGRSNAEIFQAREHFSCPADRPSRGTLPPRWLSSGKGPGEVQRNGVPGLLLSYPAADRYRRPGPVGDATLPSLVSPACWEGPAVVTRQPKMRGQLDSSADIMTSSRPRPDDCASRASVEQTEATDKAS